MKKIIVLLLVLCFVNINAKADEGMWIPFLMEKGLINNMGNKGLKITQEDIASINKSCLASSVINFGNICTSSFISEKGLLLTNFHCALQFITPLSTIHKDIVKKGFWAKSQSEELKIEGLNVSQLNNISDITSAVNKYMKNIGVSDKEAIASIQDSISSENFDLLFSIEKLNDNFYLFKYKTLSDIRLVALPPMGLANFGGEAYNFAWENYNADFTVFRVYTDSITNSVSENSAISIPYKTNKHLEICTKGINDNDFVFCIGYPGYTNRRKSSIELSCIYDYDVKASLSINDTLLKILKNSFVNKEIELKYMNTYKSTENYNKILLGQKAGFEKENVIKDQIALEIKYKLKANQVLDSIKVNISELEKYKSLQIWGFAFSEKYFSIIPDLMNAIIYKGKNIILDCASDSTCTQTRNSIKNEIVRKLKEEIIDKCDIAVENKIFAALIYKYIELVPKDLQIVLLKNKTPKKINEYITEMTSKSVFLNYEKLLKAVEIDDVELLRNDQFYQLFCQLSDSWWKKSKKKFSILESKINSLNKELEAIYKENHELTYQYNDANSTMRLSYGMIKGYESNNKTLGIKTNLNDAFNIDKIIQNQIYKLPTDFVNLIQNTKDFEFFKKTIEPCFISNLDITGGNSGSPVFNAEGKVVGLLFDGNLESTLGTYKYYEKNQRAIAMDIRYMLWMIKYYGKAPYLTDEILLK